MRWFQHQRIIWINESLYIFGYINREHIMKKFDVSVAQASLDLQICQELDPQIKYNKRLKRYVRLPTS
jgi:hypothetical protein